MSEKPRWQKLEQAQTLLANTERKLALYQHQTERLQTIVDTLTEQETRHQLDALLTRWQGELPTVRYAGKTLAHWGGEFDYWLIVGKAKVWFSADRDGCLFVYNQQVTIEDLQREVQP